MNTKEHFMNLAIHEGYEAIKNKDGGPFGAVIVKDDKIIAMGHNHVLSYKDPTCHGEINAIRKACIELDTFDLSGCIMYTTGRCCPMCLAASMWANIDHIYYSCTLEDNEMIGFRDNKFDKLFGGRNTEGYEEQIMHEEALKLFKDYLKTNPQNY